MARGVSSPITRLLAAVGQGDAAAHEKLWSLVYDELHRLAQGQLANEGRGARMQPTSLVHEAYLRLTGDENAEWANRRHFFASAANAMRRIRVDDARKRKSLKRGGGRQRSPLDEDPPAFDQNLAEVLAINEAVTRLEQRDPLKAEIVTLRYFAGLTVDETATALGLAPRTVDKKWSHARAWLHRELSRGDTSERGGG